MTFEPLNRNGIAKWRWQFATQRLRDAYEAARSSLDGNMKSLDKEWKRWRETDVTKLSQSDLDGYGAWGGLSH